MPVRLNNGVLLRGGVMLSGEGSECGCCGGVTCEHCAFCCYSADSTATVSIDTEWAMFDPLSAGIDAEMFVDMPRTGGAFFSGLPNGQFTLWGRTDDTYYYYAGITCEHGVWFVGFGRRGDIPPSGEPFDPITYLIGEAGRIGVHSPPASCCGAQFPYTIPESQWPNRPYGPVAPINLFNKYYPAMATGSIVINGANEDEQGCTALILCVDSYTWTAEKDCLTGDITVTGPVVTTGIFSTMVNDPSWVGAGTECQWTATARVKCGAPAPEPPSTDTLNCCEEICVDKYTYSAERECPNGAVVVTGPDINTDGNGAIGDSEWFLIDRCKWERVISVECGASAPSTPEAPEPEDCCDTEGETECIERYKFTAYRNCSTDTTTVTGGSSSTTTGVPYDTDWVKTSECNWVRYIAVPCEDDAPEPNGDGLKCCDDDPNTPGPGDGGGPGVTTVYLRFCKDNTSSSLIVDTQDLGFPGGLTDGDVLKIANVCYVVDINNAAEAEANVAPEDVQDAFESCAACTDCCSVHGHFYGSESKIAGFYYQHTARSVVVDFDDTVTVGAITYGVRTNNGSPIDAPHHPDICNQWASDWFPMQVTSNGTDWARPYPEYDPLYFANRGAALVELNVTVSAGVPNPAKGGGWRMIVGDAPWNIVNTFDNRLFWGDPAVDIDPLWCGPEDGSRTIDVLDYTEEEYDEFDVPTGRTKEYYTRYEITLSGTLVDPNCQCEENPLP